MTASDQPRFIERAFVGYKIAPKTGELFIRVCCRCPDRGSLEAWAKAKGTRVTYTYCEPCYSSMMAEAQAYAPHCTNTHLESFRHSPERG